MFFYQQLTKFREKTHQNNQNFNFSQIKIITLLKESWSQLASGQTNKDHEIQY